MLTGIHFLLSYKCTYECDHCFLYCSPNAEGTFTCAQVEAVLTEAAKIPTMEWIYFEGGEPFLYYALMLEGLRLAKQAGFKTGIVTNSYWATSDKDAELWLRPIAEIGLDDLSLSDDEFHYPNQQESPAKCAARAAARLGIAAGSICIEKPVVQKPADGKGKPVVGGGALFKGRAVEKLTEGLPHSLPGCFRECKHEELARPERVHVDSYGNAQVCQGISIGNIWETPLSLIDAQYDVSTHPICGPLQRGGPDLLASTYDVRLDGQFVDECHYCFLVRRALIDRFPQYLAPRQVYGLVEEPVF